MSYKHINFILQWGSNGASSWSCAVNTNYKPVKACFYFHFPQKAPLWLTAKAAVFARGWSKGFKPNNWLGSHKKRWITFHFTSENRNFATTGKVAGLVFNATSFEIPLLYRPKGYDFSRWFLAMPSSTTFDTAWSLIFYINSFSRLHG